jgi:hypothetical protein
MLFQRLYNWIKYKTLPTSFLFKNRLFIERDSKHRRIFSNFGLSFRNSKWTNYETYNIKLQFKKSYFRFIFWIIFFFISLLFLFYFKQYYIFYYFFNNFSFLFWISIDTFDYYLSFFIWLITIGFSIFFNLIYSYFFFNNFSSNLSNKNLFSNKSFSNLKPDSYFFSNNLNVSKHDLNWIMYSWLTNVNSKNNEIVLEKLFETKINKQWWNDYYDFFIKLYKLSFYLNLSSESTIIKNLNLNKINNKYFKGDYLSILNFFNNNSNLNKYSNLLLFFFLNNYKNYFEKKNKNNPSLSFINNNSEWNLFNLNQELENYSFLIKSRSGMFFLDDFNYQKLSYFIFNYEELWTLNMYLKNQLNSAKWNRWLYRYSILHRKILKNSHKLTLSKKIINSGFYDSKIFNKNVWASEHLSFINDKNNFNSLYFNYYKNLFTNDLTNFSNYNFSYSNNYTQKNSLSLLNFYENSYFWYLKRFYIFNSLSNNYIKSKLNININNNNNNTFSQENYFLKYSIFLSYLLKSYYINLSNYSHFFDNNLNLTNFYKNFDFINLTDNKDLFLLNNENDLLSKDNVSLLYWITSNSNKNNNLIFFNYLNSSKFYSNNFNNILYLNNVNNYFNLNYWLLYSLINIDKYYLNDVLYLSLFN